MMNLVKAGPLAYRMVEADVYMARKRKNAQGAGIIRKRSDGRWEACFSIGYTPAIGKQEPIYGKT